MEFIDQIFKLFTLDIRSAMAFLFWGNFTLAILVFIFLISNVGNDTRRQFLVFGFSKLFQSVAWLAFFIRVDIVNYSPINFLVPNTLFFMSYYLESIAMLMIVKTSSKKNYIVQFVIFLIILFGFYTIVWLEYDSNIRVSAVSFFFFLLLAIPTYLFFKEVRTSLFMRLLSFNYGIILSVLLFRTIYPLLYTSTSLYSTDVTQKIVFLIIFLVLISSGVGYLLLLQEEKEIQIKKLLSDKDAFFSIIAHDLRGSFSGILGLSEMLLEKENNIVNKEREEFVQLIYQSSKNTFSLLENLLSWSQSQTGRIDFNPSKVEVNTIVSRTISLLTKHTELKNISIKSTIESEEFIIADANMLETIFRNLISNAIKFTNTNGQVTVSMIKESKQFIFSIKDNGVGISQEKMKKLFAIDSKKSTSGTHEELGTGLGLILCKDFVEKHQGAIWVDSEENQGSAFMFSIPVQ
jgi:signal transduction histidine kinase